MPISPLITVKAGKIDVDVRLHKLTYSNRNLLTTLSQETGSKPYKSKPVAAKGYIYVYEEDGNNTLTIGAVY